MALVPSLGGSSSLTTKNATIPDDALVVPLGAVAAKVAAFAGVNPQEASEAAQGTSLVFTKAAINDIATQVEDDGMVDAFEKAVEGDDEAAEQFSDQLYAITEVLACKMFGMPEMPEQVKGILRPATRMLSNASITTTRYLPGSVVNSLLGVVDAKAITDSLD